LSGSMRGTDAEFAAVLVVDGQRLEWTIVCPSGKEAEDRRILGFVAVEVDVDRRWDTTDLDIGIERTDVYQGMYDDE
ncbi:MAG TPA: hypothetical protein PLC54_04370, partial [Spirochaetales bacterium]|nr:hypothetical protein [Spirochaetales bacterium]